MTAPALIEVNTNPNPFTAARALNRLRTAGVVVELDGTRLVVSAAEPLTEAQRTELRTHKAALVALLVDAATVYSALAQAGSCGLDWREGTPADWPDARLLAADEVLYSDGRMVNRNDRRYLREHAPEPSNAPGENCP